MRTSLNVSGAKLLQPRAFGAEFDNAGLPAMMALGKLPRRRWGGFLAPARKARGDFA